MIKIVMTYFLISFFFLNSAIAQGNNDFLRDSHEKNIRSEIYQIAFDAKINLWECSLATPFDGSFLGRGISKVSATVSVKKKCEQEIGSSFWCKDRYITCQKLLSFSSTTVAREQVCDDAWECVIDHPAIGFFSATGPTESIGKERVFEKCDKKWPSGACHIYGATCEKLAPPPAW